MSESPDPARNRFFILQFMRASGAGFILMGAAMLAGKIAAPAPFGVGLMLIGAFEALILPGLIIRNWKSRD